MVIHSNEEYPLFVDPTKKGDHFPTGNYYSLGNIIQFIFIQYNN